MREYLWDKKLNIRTGGRDDTHADQYRFPYEPTPYRVLDRLAGSGYIDQQSVVLDYGCGKGRVDFFLAHQCGCLCYGVEYDDRIYEMARRNMEKALSSSKVDIVHANAEQYEVPSSVNRIFFFNPFSVEILRSVMERIRDSWYGNPREILLFFYYPSDEYVSWLMTVEELTFLDDIDCRDLFLGNIRFERIMVFEMG